ncbi:Hpt domain-containing protein [uncultured Enterovirga sp.]|uniref:Hpt domain-containing protein n=1 Tax=uncultured Enterovirga sp. TaxID=2026352 RepID=UPI0035CB1AA3
MPQTRPHPSILDLDYLDRQTFGDHQLARDLLVLFDGQCARLVPLMTGECPRGERAEAAHALTGAARAVGAYRIASLATELEACLGAAGKEGRADPVSAAMMEASAEVRLALRRYLAETASSGTSDLAKPNRVA